MSYFPKNYPWFAQQWVMFVGSALIGVGAVHVPVYAWALSTIAGAVIIGLNRYARGLYDGYDLGENAKRAKEKTK